jgi:cytochrome P450
VARLLDEMSATMRARGSVEFIGQFASRLPIAVISALLGVPESDERWFRQIAADVTIALEGISTASRLQVADRAMVELSAYFGQLLECRGPEPLVRHGDGGDGDVLRALAATSVAREPGPDQLRRDELLGNMMLLLTAGFETTSFLLGSALVLATAVPERAQRLRDEPGYAVRYVEEVLRFEAPVQATSRWTSEETLHLGTVLAPDTRVLVVLAAGNRDPRRFEAPGVFDPDRSYIPPLSFGAGAHFCLGAPLSRLEAQVALPALFDRFDALTLVEPPIRRDTWVGRGFDRLVIAAGKERRAVAG